MEKNNFITRIDLSNRWPDLIIVGFVLFMAFIYATISGNRSFDFDEFQVLYASAALERGKALYADQIGSHFPFFNIVVSFLVSLAGFKATTILIARYFIFLTNVVALFYAYRIGKVLWDKRAGLFAVALILFSIVFVEKGIEIRHDIFNMAFSIIGAYYGLRYLKENRFSFILSSGLFLGLALASTQKAIVWIAGIIVGISLYLLRRRSYKQLLKVGLIYFAIIPVPLIASLFYLVVANHESLYQFLTHTVINVIVAYAPHTEEIYPFPYNRYGLFKELIFQNHLLYALSIGSILATIILWFRTNTDRIVVAVWALTGVLFYVTAKRPFFQTFLPSIPPLSILAAGLLSDMFKDLKDLTINKRIGVGLAAVFLLFAWPLWLAWGQIPKDSKMMRQIANISFCLENLREDDRVLSFTQNQIFFDPVLKIGNEECGKRIYDYDATCFEKRMIGQQCKVIINDHRTKLLNKEIKEKIEENYVPIKIGDILIPGFKIGPKEMFEKKIWIEGYYYSPTTSLEIDGKKIEGNLVKLEQKRYRIKNNSNRQVVLVYIFDREKFLKDSFDHLGLMKRM